MQLEEEIAATGFHLTTSRTFSEIQVLGSLAAIHSAGGLLRVQESRTSEHTIVYKLSLAWSIQMTLLALHFESDPYGINVLSLIPGQHITSLSSLSGGLGVRRMSTRFQILTTFSAFLRDRI